MRRLFQLDRVNSEMAQASDLEWPVEDDAFPAKPIPPDKGYWPDMKDLLPNHQKRRTNGVKTRVIMSVTPAARLVAPEDQ